MNPDLSTEKEKYRKVGVLEHLGEAIGGQLRSGRIRDRLRAIYHQLLMLRSGGKGISCGLPGGEFMRVLPAYRFASWNYLEYEAFKTMVQPGFIALDIGANIGTYSVLLGQWVGPQGKVYAFEPAPETFTALNQHIVMNGLQNIVLSQQKAVSDCAATLDFHADRFHGTNRILIAGESATHSSDKVQALTIDEFCTQHRLQPDFIKIDIEGFELAALRGARETLQAGRGHIALFVEMHPTTWRQIGITRKEVLAELEFQGLKAEPLAGGPDAWEIEGVCMRLVHNA